MGIVSIAEALKVAEEKGLDLIQVTEKVDPPVCRLGDYGKYLYQQEKKSREGKKQTGGETKEVRLTYTMSPHDMETRAKQAEKFLTKGNRVRITLPLRGRQRALEGYAREKAKNFLVSLGEMIPIKIERDIKREPRGLSILIAKQ